MIPRSTEACPRCHGHKNVVTYSRLGRFWRWRRYRCLACDQGRWTTYEFNGSLINPAKIVDALRCRHSSTTTNSTKS